MSSRHSEATPLIAMISMSPPRPADQRLELTPLISQKQTCISALLWNLLRLGVTTIVAQAQEYKLFLRALDTLSPPPAIPPKSHPILNRLARQRSATIDRDLFSELPLTKSIELLEIPNEPLSFDTLKLCFHDELIGDPNAFLIHYGPSHFDVSGFHHPISALSIPVGEIVSASIIARLPYQRKDDTKTIETCVIQLNSQGNITKGPWWPKAERGAL